MSKPVKDLVDDAAELAAFNRMDARTTADLEEAVTERVMTPMVGRAPDLVSESLKDVIRRGK